MLQQVHTQPIVTTINGIDRARFKGVVCLVAAVSNYNGQGDEYMLVYTVFGE